MKKQNKIIAIFILAMMTFSCVFFVTAEKTNEKISSNLTEKLSKSAEDETILIALQVTWDKSEWEKIKNEIAIQSGLDGMLDCSNYYVDFSIINDMTKEERQQLEEKKAVQYHLLEAVSFAKLDSFVEKYLTDEEKDTVKYRVGTDVEEEFTTSPWVYGTNIGIENMSFVTTKSRIYELSEIDIVTQIHQGFYEIDNTIMDNTVIVTLPNSETVVVTVPFNNTTSEIEVFTIPFDDTTVPVVISQPIDVYKYSTSDLIRLAKRISGKLTVSTIADNAELTAFNFDVNGDNLINSDDLLYMIKKLTGEIQ